MTYEDMVSWFYCYIVRRKVGVKNNEAMKQWNNSTFGFTLIELIVVMAIIAVLAAAIGGNFFSSLNKGRDSRRKQDLLSIAKALELYYNDHNAYPTPPLPAWGESFVNEQDNSVVYMSKFPTDPGSPTFNYCYESDAAGSYYRLFASIENANDPQVLTSSRVCQTDGVSYNYMIGSTNVP